MDKFKTILKAANSKTLETLLSRTNSEIDSLDKRITAIEINAESVKNKQDSLDAKAFVLFGLTVILICFLGIQSLNEMDLTKLPSDMFKEAYQLQIQVKILLTIVFPMTVIGFALRSLLIQIDNLPFRKDKAINEFKNKTLGKLYRCKERSTTHRAKLIEEIAKSKTT